MMKYFAVDAVSKVINEKTNVTLKSSFYAGIAMDENDKYDKKYFYNIADEISQNEEFFSKHPVELKVWRLDEVPDYIERESAIAENLRKPYFYTGADYKFDDWTVAHVLKF